MAAKEQIYASPEATVAIGRSRGNGFYNRRVTNMLPLLVTSITPRLSGNMSSLGVEVGSNTITEQRGQKESFSPGLTMAGHVRLGATLNLLAALGYRAITEGIPVATPVNTTVDTGGVKRNRRFLPVAATTSLGVNDYVQIGTVSGTPAATDRSEVHRIVSVVGAARSEVQTITVYGSPTGGTFRLGYNGVKTASLPYNASLAAVTAALEGLPGIGTGNVTVTGTAGTTYVVTFAGALANLPVLLLYAEGDSLTGGTGFGANAGLPGQNDSYIQVDVTTEAVPGVAVELATNLLYDYAAAVAVSKVDPNKQFNSYFFHVQPSDVIDNDGFSVYVKFSNGQNTYSLLFFDGKASSFSLSFSAGNIATFSTDMKFGDVAKVDPSTVTLVQDPSPITLNNTRGSFDYLGNTVDAPRSITVTNTAEIPDDFTLFRYKTQSVQHTGYTLTMTTEGKFVKDLSEKINFNNGDATVSDVIPEYPLSFRFLSQKLIGATAIPYELSIHATDVQYSEYDPNLSTNTFISASIGMIRIVPDGTNENWYFKSVSKNSSDVYGSR
jgi:hypothetical protein